MRVITLTTDFGTRDPYVGTMKGVIYGIASDVHVVDLTHEIEKQDVIEAAIVLKSTRGFFPKGTIHLCVVDPGVGSARKPIVVESDDQLFVGPNNGAFSYVLEPGYAAWELSEPAYRLPFVSDTFHGRDIFAPAAAHLARGVAPAKLGPPLDELERYGAREPMTFRNHIQGEVVHVDSFGNLITNISRETLERRAEGRTVSIEVSGRTIDTISRAYADVSPGDLVALIGGTELLEIAVRDGSANRKLGVGRGDPVRLTLTD